MIFYAPYESIINGGANKMAQMGAAHCLFELFKHLKQEANNDFLLLVLQKYLPLFIVLCS